MFQSLKVIYLYCCYWYLLDTVLPGTNAQLARCNNNQWKCKNGDCINAEELCDGGVHCSDGSDETAENCSDIDCPGFAFQCAYGACIAGNSKCNGVKECADASDEAPRLCGQGQGPNKELSSCSSNSFQCDSGQCIADDKACDGKKDCGDGSDETVKLCSTLSCPSFAFKCGYGACVSGNAKCNGVVECHDGSDESQQLCKSTQTSTDRRPPVNITSGVTNIFLNHIPKPLPAITSNHGTSCLVGDHSNAIIVADHDNTIKIYADEWVDEFRSIVYTCERNYFLFGAEKNTCHNASWIYPIPTCSKVCPDKVIEGITFEASCKYNGVGHSCSGFIRPGTQAHISCSVGYRKPQRVVPDVLVCEDHGDWDYHPYRCEPVCGAQIIAARPFINGGVKTNITSVPWHVAIYRLKSEKYTQICGGTIISAKIIVSAAHCFWDVLTSAINDHRLYTVVVGKVFRDYYATEPLNTQFFNLSEIHAPPGYKHADLAYQHDIAVLVLNNFIRFQNHIKPICMKWYTYTNRDIQPNTTGLVAGWGRTGVDDAGFSDELKTVELPAVSNSECIKKLTQTYNKFVTGEKFCVGAPNWESVCEGDSGGGFVVATETDGVTTYYLWGILSVSLSSNTCNNDHYTSFTNIQYHKEMLTDYESRFRPK